MDSRRKKNVLQIDWQKIEGASGVRKKLYLRPNESGVFHCPINSCLHAGFKSCRGCRKHVNTKHAWYFYFENIPDVKEEIVTEARKKHTCIPKYLHKPYFSIDEGFGHQFKTWLTDHCGGGKDSSQAAHTSRRAMKYLMFVSEFTEARENLDNDFVDFCIGSAHHITQFLKILQEEWLIGYSGTYNYLNAIQDLMDFRKAQSVSDYVLRSFSVTEVYIRRGKRNISKKKKAEWSRNFDLETLMANNCWATVEDMETVIPFHLPRFKDIVQKCITKPTLVGPSDLTFSVRFITTLLFLRVKCSRPMTFQHLTVPMFEKSKDDSGYIDQRSFKTSGTYLYDTIIIDDDVSRLIDLYVNHCRPLLNPTSDFLLISSTGNMLPKLTNGMTILVYEAIKKHIHPTRYRQIIESASSDRLTLLEQEIISQDQKHNSEVARVFYKKRLSREVAIKGKEYVEKMAGESRLTVNKAISTVLSDIERVQHEYDTSFLPPDITASTSSNSNIDFSGAVIVDERSSPRTTEDLTDEVQHIMSISNTNEPVTKKIKLEEIANNSRPLTRFTKVEDEQLANGIRKYGRGCWAAIIADTSLVFENKHRNRDSLRIRAGSQFFKRVYKC